MTAPAPVLHRVPRRPRAWIAWFVVSQVVALAAWWVFGWTIGLPLLLATHVPFVRASLHPRSWLYTPFLDRLPIASKRVWLTIDDGPSDDTLAVLDLLDAHRMQATFFLVGARAEARPDLVREIAARGHGIGNHSHTHPQAWFWALGPRRMRTEIVDCQRALTAVTGEAPRWFRAVVGHSNPFVGPVLRDERLARAAWTARGFDAVQADPAVVVARIERDLAPGAIVLLHEGAPHGRSVETIAALLARMDALGYGSVLPEHVEAGLSQPAPSLAR